MAVYKATYCYPFLTSYDVRLANLNLLTGQSEKSVKWLSCKIDSSNKNITGYSIRILNEYNEVIFPVTKEKKISPISELKPTLINGIYQINGVDLINQEWKVNSGLNGTYLNIPFFQTSNNNTMIVKSANAVYSTINYRVNYIIRPLDMISEQIRENSDNYNNWVTDGLSFRCNITGWKGTLNGDHLIKDQTVLVIDNNHQGYFCKVVSSSESSNLKILNNIILEDLQTILIDQGSYHNQIYQYIKSTQKFQRTSDNFIRYKDIYNNTINLNNLGSVYKWEITLYQGDGEESYELDNTIMVISYENINKEKYCDMMLSEGTILGSKPGRLQIAYSDNGQVEDEVLPQNKDGSGVLLYHKWAQLLTESNTDASNRFYVNSYDETYGHIYPLETDANTLSLNGVSKVQFFPHSNDLDSITANDRVNVASSLSDGQIETDNTSQFIISGNIELVGIQDLDGVSGFSGCKVLLMHQKQPEENGVYIMASDVNNSITVDKLVYKRDTEKDYYRTINNKNVIFSFAWTTTIKNVAEDTETKKTLYTRNRYVKRPVVSGYEGDKIYTDPTCLNDVGSKATEVSMSIWSRAGAFDSWGDFIGKIIYVESGIENGHKNFDSLANAGGQLLITPYKSYDTEGNYNYDGSSSLYFVPERPILLFSQKLSNYNIRACGIKSINSSGSIIYDNVIMKEGQYALEINNGYTNSDVVYSMYVRPEAPTTLQEPELTINVTKNTVDSYLVTVDFVNPNPVNCKVVYKVKGESQQGLTTTDTITRDNGSTGPIIIVNKKDTSTSGVIEAYCELTTVRDGVSTTIKSPTVTKKWIKGNTIEKEQCIAPNITSTTYGNQYTYQFTVENLESKTSNIHCSYKWEDETNFTELNDITTTSYSFILSNDKKNNRSVTIESYVTYNATQTFRSNTSTYVQIIPGNPTSDNITEKTLYYKTLSTALKIGATKTSLIKPTITLQENIYDELTLIIHNPNNNSVDLYINNTKQITNLAPLSDYIYKISWNDLNKNSGETFSISVFLAPHVNLINDDLQVDLIQVIKTTPGLSTKIIDFDFSQNKPLYFYIEEGAENGKSVVKVSTDTKVFLNNTDLYTAILLYNTKERTYISPFIGISEQMLLKFKGNVIKLQDNQYKQNYLSIKSVNKNLWYITHNQLESPLLSYLSLQHTTSDEIPYKYKLISFFKTSDENPFYLYEDPYIGIYRTILLENQDKLSREFTVLDTNNQKPYVSFDIYNSKKGFKAPNGVEFDEESTDFSIIMSDFLEYSVTPNVEKSVINLPTSLLNNISNTVEIPAHYKGTFSQEPNKTECTTDTIINWHENHPNLTSEDKDEFENTYGRLWIGEAQGINFPTSIGVQQSHLFANAAIVDLTSGYRLNLTGIYNQQQGGSWEAYRWVVSKPTFKEGYTFNPENYTDALDNIVDETVLQDTGRRYDKEINVNFYGLFTQESEQNISETPYIVHLYLEDDLGNTIHKKEIVVVESGSLSSVFTQYLSQFTAIFDKCNACVDITINPAWRNSNSDLTQLGLTSFSVFKREYRTMYKDGISDKTITVIGDQWYPVALNVTVDGKEAASGNINIKIKDYNIKNNYSYQYIIFPNIENTATDIKVNYIYANTPVQYTQPFSSIDLQFKSQYSKPVEINFDYWSLVELIPNEELIDAPIAALNYTINPTNIWLFKYSLDTGSLTQTMAKNEINTLGQFNRYGHGLRNTLSGSVSCYLGSEIVPLSKIGYIERMPYARNQPISTNDANTMLLLWRQFVYSKNPKLLRNLKGESWIVQITESSNTTNNFTHNYPDTISFSWKQIEKTDTAIISLINSEFFEQNLNNNSCVPIWEKQSINTNIKQQQKTEKAVAYSIESLYNINK